ncbi:MAG: hypothetical protein ACXWTG_12745 [Methylosarcina sp.]
MTQELPHDLANVIAARALEFREEMKQYGESVSCSEAVNAILANITSIPTDDVSERFSRPSTDAYSLKKDKSSTQTKKWKVAGQFPKSGFRRN